MIDMDSYAIGFLSGALVFLLGWMVWAALDD